LHGVHGETLSDAHEVGGKKERETLNLLSSACRY
jgi:hypothetical protein